jgi:hypothetical protein
MLDKDITSWTLLVEITLSPWIWMVSVVGSPAGFNDWSWWTTFYLYAKYGLNPATSFSIGTSVFLFS